MKKIIYLFLNIITILLWAPSLAGQAQEEEYFDPEHDPVLSIVNGKMRFMVSEEVMVRAVDIRVTKLGQIESIYKKQLYDDWYIFIEGREIDKIEQSIVVVLKLRKEEGGNYYAAHSWYACIGDSCGSCGYDETNLEACFCKSEDPSPTPHTAGFCYSVWSNDPLFYKIPLKAKI